MNQLFLLEAVLVNIKEGSDKHGKYVYGVDKL